MLAAIYKQTITTCQDILDSLPSASQLVRNVQKVALPMIAILSVINIQQAKAGPVSWFACIVACEAVAASATAATAGAAAGSLLACVKACDLLLPLPFCP